MQTVARDAILQFLTGLVFFVLFQGCSADQGKKHFVLAEQLWTDHKYGAAILEFEKVYQREPRSKLGQNALYRAAMTQSLFLKQYPEALEKLRTFAQISTDDQLTWKAQLEIGEILYSNLESYDQVLIHYPLMMTSRPNAPEVPEILYRMAKSEFFLFRFEHALQRFQNLIQRFPDSSWAEKAQFERGVTLYTRGETQKHSSDFTQAVQEYQNFMIKHPQSGLIPQAKFGIASCYEELDRQTEALTLYSSLEKTYPAPGVIQMKIARLKKRIHQIN